MADRLLHPLPSLIQALQASASPTETHDPHQLLQSTPASGNPTVLLSSTNFTTNELRFTSTRSTSSIHLIFSLAFDLGQAHCSCRPRPRPRPRPPHCSTHSSKFLHFKSAIPPHLLRSWSPATSVYFAGHANHPDLLSTSRSTGQLDPLIHVLCSKT